jgi:hypothetical protein
MEEVTVGGMVAHFNDCWRFHPSCALKKIAELQAENVKMFNALHDRDKEVQKLRSGIGKAINFLADLIGKEFVKYLLDHIRKEGSE